MVCYRRTNKNWFLELYHLIYKESIRSPLQVYFGNINDSCIGLFCQGNLGQMILQGLRKH